MMKWMLAICLCAGCSSAQPSPEKYVWEQEVVELTVGNHSYRISPSTTPGRMLVSLDGGKQELEFQLPEPITQVVDVKASPWISNGGVAMAMRGR